MFKKLPLVGDYMDTNVPTVHPEMEIFEAVRFLLEHQVSGAPVLDGANELVGILSEKDCLSLLATGHDHQRASGTVAEFMTRDVQYIPPDMNVFFAAGMFLRSVFRRFPVVEKGRLVGAITRFDILRAIDESHSNGR